MDNQEGCCSKPNKSPKQDCCSKPDKRSGREIFTSPRSGVRIISLLLVAILFLLPIGSHYTLNAKTVLTDHTMSLIKGAGGECKGRTCKCKEECGGSGREGTACTGPDDCGGKKCKVTKANCAFLVQDPLGGLKGWYCNAPPPPPPFCEGGTQCKRGDNCKPFYCRALTHPLYATGCLCEGKCKCKK